MPVTPVQRCGLVMVRGGSAAILPRSGYRLDRHCFDPGHADP